MRASHYAHALKDMLATHAGSEALLLEHFVGTVLANGHRHLFPKITRSLERIIAKTDKANTIEVTSAKDISVAEVTLLLKKAPYHLALSSNHKKVVRRTDEGIVGGVIVRTDAVRIDASHKRTLLDLYQNMTGNL